MIERESCYYETVERHHEKTDFESNNRTENIYENIPVDADETDRSVGPKLEEPDLVVGLDTPTLNLPAACPVSASEIAFDPKSVKDRMFLSTDDASCLLFTQTVTSPMLTPSEENIDFLKGFNQNTHSDNSNAVASQNSDEKTYTLGNARCGTPSHAPNNDGTANHVSNTADDKHVQIVPDIVSHAPAAIEDAPSPTRPDEEDLENIYENDDILGESENIYENIDDLRTDLKAQTIDFIRNETYDQLPSCRPIENPRTTVNESENAYEIVIPSAEPSTNSPEPTFPHQKIQTSVEVAETPSNTKSQNIETSNFNSSNELTSNIDNTEEETSNIDSFNEITSNIDNSAKETSNSNEEQSNIDKFDIDQGNGDGTCGETPREVEGDAVPSLHIVETLKKQFCRTETNSSYVELVEMSNLDVTERINKFENIGPSKEDQPTNSCDDVVVSLLFCYYLHYFITLLLFRSLTHSLTRCFVSLLFFFFANSNRKMCFLQIETVEHTTTTFETTFESQNGQEKGIKKKKTKKSRSHEKENISVVSCFCFDINTFLFGTKN